MKNTRRLLLCLALALSAFFVYPVGAQTDTPTPTGWSHAFVSSEDLSPYFVTFADMITGYHCPEPSLSSVIQGTQCDNESSGFFSGQEVFGTVLHIVPFRFDAHWTEVDVSGTMCANVSGSQAITQFQFDDGSVRGIVNSSAVGCHSDTAVWTGDYVVTAGMDVANVAYASDMSISEIFISGYGPDPFTSPTPTPTITPTPIPCGGGLCINVGSFNPPCTRTPMASFTATQTLQAVASTHVFPTVAPFSTISTATLRATYTASPGPTTTPFQTSIPTSTLVGTPTATATTACFIPSDGIPIVNYGEHDIPGGTCYRLTPPVSIAIDALNISGHTIIPSISVVAHPLDFCYTLFQLDVKLADIDLWSWLLIVFDLWLVAWIINVLRANG